MTKLHIVLEENQTIWFTSDLHFGHKNIIKFGNRPYKDEKEMNQNLIKNWNDVVGENDIVFVLGDTFWFNDSQSIKKFISQLNGKTIYFLPGNHDDFEKWYRLDDSRIILCDDTTVLWLADPNKSFDKRILEIWMNHYPLMTWPHRENGAYQLFGHIHSQPNKTEGVDQDLPLHWNQCDVGCDYWNWKPVSLFHLIEKMNKNKK